MIGTFRRLTHQILICALGGLRRHAVFALASLPVSCCRSRSSAARRTGGAGGNTVDSADRLTSDTAGSYTYDTLGRTLTIPSGDAQGIGAHSTSTGAATVSYNANDMVASEQQGSTTDTFTLDPDQNRVKTQTDGATTTTDHYSDDSDSATWSSTGGTTWTRNITGIDGGLAATAAQTGTVTLQLTNPHGDTIATGADLANATGITSYNECTEYGTHHETPPPPTPPTVGSAASNAPPTISLASHLWAYGCTTTHRADLRPLIRYLEETRTLTYTPRIQSMVQTSAVGVTFSVVVGPTWHTT